MPHTAESGGSADIPDAADLALIDRLELRTKQRKLARPIRIAGHTLEAGTVLQVRTLKDQQYLCFVNLGSMLPLTRTVVADLRREFEPPADPSAKPGAVDALRGGAHVAAAVAGGLEKPGDFSLEKATGLRDGATAVLPSGVLVMMRKHGTPPVWWAAGYQGESFRLHQTDELRTMNINGLPIDINDVLERYGQEYRVHAIAGNDLVLAPIKGGAMIKVFCRADNLRRTGKKVVPPTLTAPAATAPVARESSSAKAPKGHEAARKIDLAAWELRMGDVVQAGGRHFVLGQIRGSKATKDQPLLPWYLRPLEDASDLPHYCHFVDKAHTTVVYGHPPKKLTIEGVWRDE